jgi:uncharacterized protein YdeI (BOF family)
VAISFTSCKKRYSVKGTVDKTEMGKDKYMLYMKDAEGQVYRVLVSQPHMGSEFKNVAAGDKIEVRGDTQHWQSEVHIKAKAINIIN